MAASPALDLVSSYQPAGDQPQAIEALCQGLNDGLASQVLLGVTGSGKTYTVAQTLHRLQRPAVVLAPNKTLAAQLFGEFREFFPLNAVEYFVSYYDYYQPEAYVPAADLYIEKDSSINEHIEQMRLSATKALLERQDVIVVASVSAIYGLGAPEAYMNMLLHVSRGEVVDRRAVHRRLAEMQYQRNDVVLQRGCYRSQGETLDVHPADSDRHAIRLQWFDDRIEHIAVLDPLNGHIVKELPRVTIYPKTHYATPKETIARAGDQIAAELKLRVAELRAAGKGYEAQRLDQRTRFDLEMIQELGYCTGIENYSRYLSGREPGQSPPTLFDYLPDNTVVVVDESHVTVPQLRGCYRGDRSRKETLVEHGFRLPSALDNRPLRFEEWEQAVGQVIFVSATPGPYERECAGHIVEQLVRPTGLLDPRVEVRPASTQVDDLLSMVGERVARGDRVLVTALTKRMAEDLTDYLGDHGVRARYLHADVDTVERVAILRDLRLGEFDVLVGINLLREGLDLPEVSLVAILDADKEGFLRSESALIQIVGRAARHLHGSAIMYADVMTGSMRRALDETDRRRGKQLEFNERFGIVPVGISKAIKDVLGASMDRGRPARRRGRPDGDQKAADPAPGAEHAPEQWGRHIAALERRMREHAKNLEFEQAAGLRDEISAFKANAFFGDRLPKPKAEPSRGHARGSA